MNFDDIRKLLQKTLAERMRMREDELFGQMRQAAMFQAQREAQARVHDDRSQAFAYGRAGMNMRAGTTFTVDMNSAGPGKLIWPDDGKEITLTEDDYKVIS